MVTSKTLTQSPSTTLAPSVRYAKHVNRVLAPRAFVVVTVPDGTAAAAMGYGFVAIPSEDLADYLAHGASLAWSPLVQL